MTPEYSLILVTWNNLQYTARCVESLFRTLPLEAEIVFVDNASDDGTRAYLADVARRPGVAAKTVFLDDNLGFPDAANRGIEDAGGQTMVFLHNYVIVTAGWLEGLRECLEEAPAVVPGLRRVGLAGPVTNRARGPQQVQNARPLDPATLDEHARRHREALRRKWASSFVLSTFCLMARREVIAAIGGFDERFFPGGHDDSDLVLRAQERGFDAVIAGDVYVHHEGRSTPADLSPSMPGGAANVDLFLDKWRSRRAGRTRLVAAYTTRDAEGTLRRSLDATARFADAIVVVDSGSKDGTAAIARSHPAVTRFEREEPPGDELTSRNRALALAAELSPDWVLVVEPDEVFDMTRARAERLMQLADPHAKALAFHFYTLWEPTGTYFRADGPLGARVAQRMYRHEPGLRVARADGDGIPDMPDGCGRVTNVRVLQLGLETEATRERAGVATGTMTLRKLSPRQGLSLCIITRNEAERLERFLAFFEPFVDEINVVDNGSYDATVEIARKFTDRVQIHLTDRLDLAEVRNVGLAMATQPWILSMDPDEDIAEWDLPRLARLMDDPDACGYSFEVVNHQKEAPPVMTIAVRLFRNDPRIRYGRPVHETVQQSFEQHPELMVRQAHVNIQHYGFLKDDTAMEAKLEKYLEASQRMREEEPADPMPWYNEGLHLLNDGREEDAILFLERAIALGERFLSPRTSLAQIYQTRALALWQSVAAELPPDHPVRPAADDSVAALGRITPPRPRIGLARKRGPGGP